MSEENAEIAWRLYEDISARLEQSGDVRKPEMYIELFRLCHLCVKNPYQFEAFVNDKGRVEFKVSGFIFNRVKMFFRTITGR